VAEELTDLKGSEIQQIAPADHMELAMTALDFYMGSPETGQTEQRSS
jgi:hypothetical protein